MLTGLLAALAVVLLLASVAGIGLQYAARHYRGQADPLVEKVNAALPQTQCAQCGFPGCLPYAEAIVSGSADIDQCPPGGEQGVIRLAQLLGREPKPVNAEFGTPPEQALVALIDETTCIGCVLCIQACPVDAIIGAQGLMHTVVAELCTGCELCIPPCPVDCITLERAPEQHAPIPAPAMP